MKIAIKLVFLLCVVMCAGAAWGAGDDPFFAGTEKFAKGAKNVTEVTLDQKMLRMASGFIGNDKDSEEVKRITGKLKGIFVRSYEYDKEGQYSQADIEQYRKQLDQNSEWSHIVKERSTEKGGENTDVYMLSAQGKVAGIVIIDAEPMELSFVHIDGQIDPEDLSKLSGNMGVPKISRQPKPALHKKDADSGKSELRGFEARATNAAGVELAQ